MPNFTYTIGIPDSPDNPSNDQPNMKINNDSNNSIWGIDHIGFNSNNSGYHTIIHQPQQGTWNAVARTGDPVTTPGFQQTFPLLYTPDYTGAVSDTQLFTKTSGGGTSQLSGSASQSDGWVWSGGLLFQWGIVTTVTSGSFSSGSATGSVTFKDRPPGSTIRFPSNCFIVIATPFWSTASTAPDGSGSVNVNQTTLSATKFDWKFNSSSGKYTGFFWYAIGI